MPHRRLSAAAATAALLALPAAASAQTSALTPADGFSLKRAENGRLSMDISAKGARAYRAIAGRRGVLTCQEERPTTGPVLPNIAIDPDVQVFTTTLPKQRKRVTFKRRAAASLDSCELVVAGKTRAGKTKLIADLLIPLTERGAEALQERTLVAQLSAVSVLIGTLSGTNAEGVYPTTDAIVAQAAKLKAIDGVEALPSPDATPSAPGIIGVWSDGAQHAVVAVLTAQGRRLFIDATNETLSSNTPIAYGG